MATTGCRCVALVAEILMTDVIGWQMATRWARDLSVIVDATDGVIVAAGMQPLPALRVRWAQRFTADASHVRSIEASSPMAQSVVSAWQAFESGDMTALTWPEVRHVGGEFQMQVWSHMRDVGAGEVVSYAELARRAGRAAAVRAVGTACATNLIAPFTPCHRVIRSDGGLGGYGYGVDLKRDLLRHEGWLTR